MGAFNCQNCHQNCKITLQLEFSAEQVGYYLCEENNWGLSVEELERAYQSSLDRCEPRAICIINPGNRLIFNIFYCLELLESTGICVVPGSGFLQKSGTYHLRTTILPPIDQIITLLSSFEKFHLEFLKKWSP